MKLWLWLEDHELEFLLSALAFVMLTTCWGW